MRSYPVFSGLRRSHPPWMVVLLCCSLLLVFPSGVFAQQPTATISNLQGTVTVSIQGQAAMPATIGVALRTSDTITTGPGASVALTLSEGSALNFGENTTVDITALSQRPGTQVRTSRLRLLAGKIRAFLSPGHQEKGSSFTIDTPNAIAGVKFSQPDIMVSYDPATETTIIEAYTVDVVVRNLISQEVREVPKGNRGIVRRERTTFSPLGQRETPETDEAPEEEPPPSPEPEIEQPPKTEIKSSGLVASRDAIRQSTTSTVPSSVGTVGTGETAGATVAQPEDTEESEESAESAEPAESAASETESGSAETATNPSPGSTTDTAGGGAETSTNPSPGVRPSRPDRQSRTIQVHIENE